MRMSSLFCKTQRSSESAFTLAEVLIAAAVCVLFGAAAFATNQRLLIALKSQKETTAASMMLQERMEAFRAIAYSSVASNQSGGSQNPTAVDILQTPSISEAALGNLTETITVSGYLLASGKTGSTHTNQWVRNSQYPTGNGTDTYPNDASCPPNTPGLACDYDLVTVDILLKWTGPDARPRIRDLSAIFGKGNIGQ